LQGCRKVSKYSLRESDTKYDSSCEFVVVEELDGNVNHQLHTPASIPEGQPIGQ